jgi:hypothetical protein
MMKIRYLCILFLCLNSLQAFSRDVNVRGYTRSNGTYVAPHVRSSPDSTKSNNYGAKSKSSTGLYDRDTDDDGTYNQYDEDDDNDGISDDDE